MTNPAVVILTDPARCQLAEAETLLQALLQVQQLNKAGVPASQAFCDHPAAAMEFIEAYSKVYPALQLQTSDLPLPQHLYSMVADGRVSPLPPVVAGETAKLEQVSQVHPLYVLSLGAPEALMQALQHNSLAKSSFRVLEIAPIEQAKAEPVSVAEAVAGAPLARSSWQTESSSGPEREDGATSGIEPLADNSVELASVEVDLDRIQIDSAGDRQAQDQNGRMHDEPVPAVIQAGVAGAESSPSGVGRQTTAEAPASSNAIPDPVIPSADPVTPTSEPVSDARPASPTDLSGRSITQSDVPPVIAESASADGAAAHDEPAREDTGPSDPVGAPGEQDMAFGGDGPMPPASGPAESEAEVDDAAPAGPSAPESDDQNAVAGHACTFAIPGEDVLYQPTGSFSGDDDLDYALPTEGAGAPSFFATLFDVSEGAEVVDLEAMYRDLSEPAAEGWAALKGFDLVMMRAPKSDRADPNEAPAAYAKCEGSVTQRNPEPDEDEALNNPVTTVHDADI